MNKKSGIKINPAHAGEFTEKAGRAGMSVQEFARHVLAVPEGHYSVATRKQANFAKNAKHFKHG